MSTEATSPLPAVARTLDELVADATAAYARQEAATLAALRILSAPDLPGSLRDLQVEIISASHQAAGLRDAIVAASLFHAVGELAVVEQAAPEPERGKHRVPRQRAAKAPASGRRHLEAVPGFKGWVVGLPLAAAFKPLSAALRHSWVAHPVATAAAPVAVVALVATAAVGPHAVATHVLGGPASGAPNPAASVVSATPLRQRDPGTVITALTRPGLDAKSARSTPPVSLVPPWVPPASSGSSQPSVSSQPSQSSQVSVSAPPVIQVSGAGSLDLTGGTPQTITVSAVGSSGWAHWSVDTGGATDLDFSKTGGVLQSGQHYDLTVSVDPVQAADGNTQETFTVGGQSVTASLPPLPAVVPSPADTSVPSPASS